MKRIILFSLWAFIGIGVFCAIGNADRRAAVQTGGGSGGSGGGGLLVESDPAFALFTTTGQSAINGSASFLSTGPSLIAANTLWNSTGAIMMAAHTVQFNNILSSNTFGLVRSTGDVMSGILKVGVLTSTSSTIFFNNTHVLISSPGADLTVGQNTSANRGMITVGEIHGRSGTMDILFLDTDSSQVSERTTIRGNLFVNNMVNISTSGATHPDGMGRALHVNGGFMATSSVTANGGFYGDGSNLTGIGAASSNPYSTCAVHFTAGGPIGVSSTTFEAVPGWVYSTFDSTVTITQIAARITSPSSVGLAEFKVAKSTGGSFISFDYISPGVTVPVNASFSSYVSTTFVIPANSMFAVHQTSVASTGTPPQGAEFYLKGWGWCKP